jgi:AcrR family transcriptional regulator
MFVYNLERSIIIYIKDWNTRNSMNDRSIETPKSNHTRARAQIISASHRLFLEQGFHGTTMRQIAKESGMALGSLYNHFIDKDDLFRAVFEAYNPYPILLLALENSQGPTAADLARTAANRLVKALAARPDLLKLVFIDVVEFQGKHLRQSYPEVAPGMERFAERLKREPYAVRGLSNDGLLRAFFGLFFTFHMTEMLLGKPTDPEEQSVALQELIEVYLHGILA